MDLEKTLDQLYDLGFAPSQVTRITNLMGGQPSPAVYKAMIKAVEKKGMSPGETLARMEETLRSISKTLGSSPDNT